MTQNFNAKIQSLKDQLKINSILNMQNNEGLYPPIPAGDLIIKSQSQALLFPRFDKTGILDHYAYAPVSELGTIIGDAEIRVAGANTHWVSDLQSCAASEPGKEQFVILDTDTQYFFSQSKGKQSLKKVKRTDDFIGTDAAFVVCPHSHIDMAQSLSKILKHNENSSPLQLNETPLDIGGIEKESPLSKDILKGNLLQSLEISTRSFYCGTSKEKGKQASILYDFNDPSFKVPLPFHSEAPYDVALMNRITSYKTTYLIFACVSWVADVYSTTLYAIPEQKLIENKSFLSIKYFSELKISSNTYPLKFFTDKFYYDDENTGSSQIALSMTSPLGDLITIKLFEIDHSAKIIEITSYENKQTNSLINLIPIEQRKHLVTYLMTEQGPTFILAYTGHAIHERCSLFPISWISGEHRKTQENISIVTIGILLFDAKTKTFKGHSSTKVNAHDHLSGVICDSEFAISKNVRFHSTMPLITYTSIQPLTTLTTGPDGFLKLDLKSINLRCSVVPIQPPALNNISGALAKPGSIEFKSINLTLDASMNFEKLQSPDGHSLEVSGLSVVDWLSPSSSGTAVTKLKDLSRGHYFLHTADLVGDSILLGTPNLTYATDLTQISALYRALPYQDDVKKAAPLINVSSSSGTLKGLSHSTLSNWQASFNAGASVGKAESLTLTNSVGANFGGHNMTMDSDTKNISLHSVSNLSSYDLVTGYGADFYLWEYPVYRKTLDDAPFNYLTVLVPIGYSQQNLDAKQEDLGYYQDYEIGSLLTYVGTENPGYKEEGLLFTPSTMTVTSDTQGGMSLTYDENSSTSKEKSRSFDISVNSGFGLNLFGLLNLGGHYSKTTIHNSSAQATETQSFSITFHSGTVSDSKYEYTLTPLVYRHAQSHALVVTSRIELSSLGSGWKDHFSRYDVRCMRSFPFTADKTLRALTRSIQYEEIREGLINLNIHLFNNSLFEAKNVSCSVYLGRVNYNHTPLDPSHLKLLKQVTLQTMAVVERKIITLSEQAIPKNSYITVCIIVDDIAESSQYFWGSYPYSHSKI
ncbi:hypothetical protein QGN29_11865 [Temperatibacter marinus]|uniref:Uncharacterized protein n=1 Tax=Temperatibacter marinus TaxID=1456591 RepID=A0AA52EGT3_9PROT|nr:hypothetical protein [Temperatibacter marinus]WND02247.1 hypothetical protein QGN29_11865 [Temperatibacter marinus]